jgi:Tfp pilus assembly protein PilF
VFNWRNKSQKLLEADIPAPPQPAIEDMVAEGVRLLQEGAFQAAQQQFSAVLVRDPEQPVALHATGFLKARGGRPDLALPYFLRAAQLVPDNPVFRSDLGNALLLAGSKDAALEEYELALAFNPQGGPFLNSMAQLQRQRGQFGRAEASFRHALELQPGHSEARLGLAKLLLARGAYEEGFLHHEGRFDSSEELATANKTMFAWYGRAGIPAWRGEPLAGKKLLVCHEQGIGDSLMMLRYMPLLKAQGAARLSFHSPPELARMAGTMGAIDRVVIDAAPIFAGGDLEDYYCLTMSLPRYCGSRLDTLPKEIPYLSIPAALVHEWSKRIGVLRGVKVGLVWAGNPRLPEDKERSLDLKQLEPLLALPGFAWISLQKGAPSRELEDAAYPVHDWMAQCTDLQDTGALIQGLDLVIAVDTAVAHLAGALGKPVWLLNRFAGDWRWGLEGEATPWYPSTRVFRQAVPGRWDDVIGCMTAELSALSAAGR